MACILVADDDPVFLEVTQLMLESRGHTVVAVPDGDAALDALATHICDLAIVDIYMPNRDGLEVILELRQTRPDLRVIAVSSLAMGGRGDQLRTARAFGAHAALAKPLDTDEIDGLIDRLLSSRATHSNFVGA